METLSVFISQMGKLKHKAVKQLSHSHRAHVQQGWGWTRSLALDQMLLTTMYPHLFLFILPGTHQRPSGIRECHAHDPLPSHTSHWASSPEAAYRIPMGVSQCESLRADVGMGKERVKIWVPLQTLGPGKAVLKGHPVRGSTGAACKLLPLWPFSRVSTHFFAIMLTLG